MNIKYKFTYLWQSMGQEGYYPKLCNMRLKFVRDFFHFGQEFVELVSVGLANFEDLQSQELEPEF